MSKFSLSLNTRYPIGWKTPFGYVMAWLVRCTFPPTAGSIFTQFPNLLIGSCWLFIFIAEDLTQDLIALNMIAKTTTHESHAELTKHLCNMVHMDSDAKW